MNGHLIINNLSKIYYVILNKSIMITIIIIILLAVIACIITYKEGELHELHKTRAAFEHYLEAHESLKEVLGPGIEAAKNLVDQLEEEDRI